MSDRYWETERGCCSECLRNSDHQTKCCETAAHRFKELSLLRAKVEESELLNEMYSELFLSAMSDDTNMGKVVRLQSTAERIKFMNESAENRQLVLNQYRQWKMYKAALSDVGSENCPHGLSYCVRCQTEGKWNIGSEGEKA